MIARRTLLLLPMCGLLAVTGCTETTSGSADRAQAGANTESKLAPNDDPVEQPSRIISQTLLSDEVLWDLGPEVRARVVAVSRLADDPAFSTLVGRWPASVPRIGGEAEAMLAHEPDLAIVASFNAAETTAMLERARVETLTLDRFSSFEDYRTNVGTLAARVGAEEQGQAIILEFDRELAQIRDRPRDRPSATILSWDDGSIAGSGTTFGESCVHAGLENVAATRGFEGHGKIDTETLLSWDPQILIIPCRQGDCGAVAASFAERPGISSTKAAREGRIVAIPAALLYATGHALLDLTRRLGSIADGDVDPSADGISEG
jgi:iron complex transport system substrate-binding protein